MNIDSGIDWAGLASIIVFYLIVLGIGVWAGWKQRREQTQADDQETVMLAGRNIGLLVGVMTMGGNYDSYKSIIGQNLFCSVVFLFLIKILLFISKLFTVKILHSSYEFGVL